MSSINTCTWERPSAPAACARFVFRPAVRVGMPRPWRQIAHYLHCMEILPCCILHHAHALVDAKRHGVCVVHQWFEADESPFLESRWSARGLQAGGQVAVRSCTCRQRRTRKCMPATRDRGVYTIDVWRFEYRSSFAPSTAHNCFNNNHTCSIEHARTKRRSLHMFVYARN